jgi:hypothetical protein
MEYFKTSSTVFEGSDLADAGTVTAKIFEPERRAQVRLPEARPCALRSGCDVPPIIPNTKRRVVDGKSTKASLSTGEGG